MITSGIDLATTARGTAVARLRWHTTGAELVELRHPASDDDVVAEFAVADRVGLDSPLGWPDAFRDFLTRHAEGPVPGRADVAWRSELTRRTTDLDVAARTGIRPLSVAADLIGLLALHANQLLARVAEDGVPVDRDGSGRVVEVYPALGVRIWGLAPRGYKARAARDAALPAAVLELARLAPWLDLGTHAPRLAASDHAFDAVVAALLARAWAVGACLPIPSEHADAARREGWIAIPATPLDGLLSPRSP